MATSKWNEHLEKVRRVRAWVKAHGYEAALITSQNSFSSITAGGNGHVSLGGESAPASILVASEGFPDEWELHHQRGLTGYHGQEVFAIPFAGHVLDAGEAPAWNTSNTGTKSEDTINVTDDTPEVLSQTEDWLPLVVELHGPRIPRPATLLR